MSADGEDRQRDLKLHLDMFMHQNNLMHGRWNLLYVTQGAFFVSIAFLRNSEGWTRAVPALIILGFALALMYFWREMINADRLLRNEHRKVLQELKFDPLPTPPAARFPYAPRGCWLTKDCEAALQQWLPVALMVADLFFAVAVICGAFGETNHASPIKGLE
jgi:hypothetical protein